MPNLSYGKRAQTWSEFLVFALGWLVILLGFAGMLASYSFLGGFLVRLGGFFLSLLIACLGLLIAYLSDRHQTKGWPGKRISYFNISNRPSPTVINKERRRRNMKLPNGERVGILEVLWILLVIWPVNSLIIDPIKFAWTDFRIRRILRRGKNRK